MEAVSVIGLVASLLQLAQFSNAILSKAGQIYESQRAATRDNVLIEDVVLHLEESIRRIDEYPLSGSEHLTTLRNHCKKVATELLKALEEVKAKGSPSRWKSVRKAIKSVRSKSKIEDWLRQLVLVRDEYNFHIEIEILYVYNSVTGGTPLTRYYQRVDRPAQTSTTKIIPRLVWKSEGVIQYTDTGLASRR